MELIQCIQKPLSLLINELLITHVTVLEENEHYNQGLASIFIKLFLVLLFSFGANCPVFSSNILISLITPIALHELFEKTNLFGIHAYILKNARAISLFLIPIAMLIPTMFRSQKTVKNVVLYVFYYFRTIYPVSKISITIDEFLSCLLYYFLGYLLIFSTKVRKIALCVSCAVVSSFLLFLYYSPSKAKNELYKKDAVLLTIINDNRLLQTLIIASLLIQIIGIVIRNYSLLGKKIRSLMSKQTNAGNLTK